MLRPISLAPRPAVPGQNDDGHVVGPPWREPMGFVGCNADAATRGREDTEVVDALVDFAAVRRQSVGRAVDQNRAAGLKQVPGVVGGNAVGGEGAPVLADLARPSGCVPPTVGVAAADGTVRNTRPSSTMVMRWAFWLTIDVGAGRVDSVLAGHLDQEGVRRRQRSRKRQLAGAGAAAGAGVGGGRRCGSAGIAWARRRGLPASADSVRRSA